MVAFDALDKALHTELQDVTRRYCDADFVLKRDYYISVEELARAGNKAVSPGGEPGRNRGAVDDRGARRRPSLH